MKSLGGTWKGLAAGGLMAVAAPGAALAAGLEPPAVLLPVTAIGGVSPQSGVNRLADTPADVFGNLRPIARRRLASGVTVSIWRYTTRFGQCERGREAATCPRGALLVSTTPDGEGRAEFGLWRSSERFSWKAAATQPEPQSESAEDLDVRLDDCEASSEVDGGAIAAHIGDTWRAATYALKIGRYGAVSFIRLPDEGPPRYCLRDVG